MGTATTLTVLPVQLGHFPRGRLAVRTRGIVEKQEGIALLKRKGLPVDGNGWGSLRPDSRARFTPKEAPSKNNYRT